MQNDKQSMQQCMLQSGLWGTVMLWPCCHPHQSACRMPAACSGPSRTVVWGWLQPGGDSSLLQPTMLKGAGLVIGRGQEEYEARQRSAGLPPLPPAGGPPVEGSKLLATLLGMLLRAVAGRQPPSEQ